MKNKIKFLLLAFITVFAVSCGDDDDGTPVLNEQTIAEFVAGNANYSSLLAALQRADLVTTLSGGDFTVFAPDNTAFEAFLNGNGFASLDDVPTDVLTNILLNHVVSGTVLSTQLSTGYVNSLATFGGTSANLSLYVDTSSGVRLNNVSSVETADIDVSNGVIHAVDAVIGIPTIVTHATSNPAFSTLVDALVAASDATIDYVALLSGTTSSPFTVFAPTNDAFASLLSLLGASSLDDIPQATLQTVLNYHVLAGANVRSTDLSEGLTPQTFQGETITITLANGPQILDATGMPANIVVVDVQSGNGVVHAIDKVLLPEVVFDALNPTISNLAMMNPNLSLLNEALQITGLDVVLDDRNAEFTVFAPTNAAFEAFLDGAALTDVPVDALTQVVLNHALTGEFFAADLTTGYTNSLATFDGTSNNLSMYINTDGGVTINGVSTVATANVDAANGVVHVVDAVIGLPTVVTFATADATFSNLVAALTRPDQAANNYVETLSTPLGTSPAPFTVFAPTDGAFSDLLTELGAGSLDDIDGPTLTATLNLHVIAGANVRAEDLVSGPVTTLGGDIIIDAANATITDANGRVINIIVTNVQAANGVVHAIDTVILPELP